MCSMFLAGKSPIAAVSQWIDVNFTNQDVWQPSDYNQQAMHQVGNVHEFHQNVYDQQAFVGADHKAQACAAQSKVRVEGYVDPKRLQISGEATWGGRPHVQSCCEGRV